LHRAGVPARGVYVWEVPADLRPLGSLPPLGAAAGAAMSAVDASVRAAVDDLTGPLPTTLDISSFPVPAKTSTKPTLRTVTLDELVKLLTTHERRHNKDGRGWSGAKYKPGTTRANANVIEWSVAGADFDHLSMDDYMELRANLVRDGLAFIIYSTYSSTPDDFRFRLAIPFTKPVPKERYADIWHRMNEHLFGGRNDPQTKDPSRMLYTPAAPEGVATVAEYVPGLALDWEKLPEASISPKKATLGPVTDGNGVGIGKETMHFLLFGADAGQQRGAVLRATRSLLSAGKSVEETTDKVWQGLQASPVGDEANPWTYEQAQVIVEDLAAREAPPLEEWGEYDLSELTGPVVEDEGGKGYFSPPGKNGHAATNRTVKAADDPTPAPKPTTVDEPTPTAEPSSETKAPTIRLRQTEMGASELLVALHGKYLRHCKTHGTWYSNGGKRWERDLTGDARRRAKAAVRSLYAMAAKIENDKERASLVAWAQTLEKAAKVAAILTLAEVEPGIPILPEQMDRDPFLFNVENGTVDLRTGQLRPHDPLDYVTKLAPVTFDPTATAPTFLAFLERVLPDADVRAFVQRAVGYSLTGETCEQCLFFLHGGGANGKSTLLTVLQALMGDYARQAAPELLVSRGGDRHPTELADLFGARAVMSVEVDEGKRLAETLVKQMTGGDKLKARFMRADFFEWTPTHKLFLAANHRPEIRGTDYAIWRRIHLVPFGVTIPKRERDGKLPEKLLAELPGILNWAIAGCLDWQRSGLGVPQAVEDATNAYRQEQDVLADFLTEHCVIDAQANVFSGALYKAYTTWCETNGTKSISNTAFGRRLTERGFTAARVGKAQTRAWKGLRLRSEKESADAFDDADAFRRGFDAVLTRF
jgi:P4 family phage/plasmid primase-like protien